MLDGCVRGRAASARACVYVKAFAKVCVSFSLVCFIKISVKHITPFCNMRGYIFRPMGPLVAPNETFSLKYRQASDKLLLQLSLLICPVSSLARSFYYIEDHYNMLPPLRTNTLANARYIFVVNETKT